MFTEEFYDHELMRKNRKEAIEKAANADKWGLILGTLGRQVSDHVYVRHHVLSADLVLRANEVEFCTI